MALGTFYNITYLDVRGRNLREGIDSVLGVVSGKFSIYDSTSLISHFNAEALEVVDRDFARLTALSLRVSRETGGAFDPTVGPVARLWGFGNARGMRGDTAGVRAALLHCGVEHLSVQGDTVRKDGRFVELTYNAIAKGFAVDQVAEYLAAIGVEDFLVEVGGEIRVQGLSPSRRAWRIGIDAPEVNLMPGEKVIDKISVGEGAVATSGNYREFVEVDGRLLGHTIDPRRGYPVQRSLVSATVYAPSCALADALATAFMVMGAKAAQGYLRTHAGIEGVLVTLRPDSTFGIWHSEGMVRLSSSLP